MITSLLTIALAAIPVRVAPASPTIGDRVTVEVREAGVTFDRASDVEFIEVRGSKATVRSMRPGPRLIRFTSPATKRSYGFHLQVRPVLAPDDALKPAPLEPPLPVPYPRAAKIALGSALAAAVISWALLWFLYRRSAKRRVESTAVPLLPARTELEQALAALAGRRDRAAAIALADATRRYLARVEPPLSLELTTSELLQRLADRAAPVTKILRAGDRAKFAPWPSEADPQLVEEARALPQTFEPQTFEPMEQAS